MMPARTGCVEAKRLPVYHTRGMPGVFCTKLIGVWRGAGQNANRFGPVSGSCALSTVPGMISAITKSHSAWFRPSSHFQLRISGRSTPLSRMYWRCSTSLSCIFWTRYAPRLPSSGRRRKQRRENIERGGGIQEAAGVCGKVTICGGELQIPLAFLCMI